MPQRLRTDRREPVRNLRRIGLTLLVAALLSACDGTPTPAPPSGTDDDAASMSRQKGGPGSADPSAGSTMSGSALAAATAFTPPPPVSCPPATVQVSSTDELEQALADAKPGDSIALADGVYVGKFVVTASGTESAPIFLCGGPGAVLDGDSVTGGYVLHLDGVAYWRVVGLTVRNGQKGIMADGMTNSVLQGLTVEHIGDEAIHLRKFSTDNVVRDSKVHETGLRREKFGEGVYIGTATSNWCTISDCEPDRSDRNLVIGNTISGTTAEAIDIKEGTSDGVAYGNTFDGSALAGADSWVDVKGNHWRILSNQGTNSPADGFQTHEVADGWGNFNIFAGNVAAKVGLDSNDDDAFAIGARPTLQNVVACDNKVDAGEVSNIPCS